MLTIVTSVFGIPRRVTVAATVATNRAFNTNVCLHVCVSACLRVCVPACLRVCLTRIITKIYLISLGRSSRVRQQVCSACVECFLRQLFVHTCLEFQLLDTSFELEQRPDVAYFNRRSCLVRGSVRYVCTS